MLLLCNAFLFMSVATFVTSNVYFSRIFQMSIGSVVISIVISWIVAIISVSSTLIITGLVYGINICKFMIMDNSGNGTFDYEIEVFFMLPCL